MFWIPIFASLFLIAFIVFGVVSNQNEKEIKKRKSSPWVLGSEASISDEDIRKEARQKIRKLKWIVYGALAGAFLIITLFSSVFITNDQQLAFTMTFGKPTIVEGTGAHLKIPFITQAYKCDATTKGMAIGFDPETDESVTEESLMITSDFNFVNTDFYVEYRVSDPIQYKYGSNNPEEILRNIVQASIRNTIGLYGVDQVITTGKGEIQAVVKEQIVEKLQQHATGLSIVNVSIQDAEPPTAEVSAAFKAVETAKQNAETAVNEAKKKEKEKIPNAQAQADQILKAAEATKTERINQATQEVAEFTALYQEYLRSPDTVKMQLYYSMLEDVLPEMEIIIGKDSKVIYVKNGQVVTQTPEE